MAILSDPQTWPGWQTEIIETDGPSPLVQGDVVEGRAQLLGFVVNGRSSTLVATESSFAEDVIVGVHMRVEYEVTPGPGGSIVKRRLTTTLPAGFSGRVLSFFLKRRLKAMQKGLLDQLVAQAEGA